MGNPNPKRKRGPGRPAKSKSEKQRHRIAVALNDRDRKALARDAKKAGMPMGTYLVACWRKQTGRGES